MKNMHKLISKIDDDILSDIISKCEAKMVEPGEGKPFKKKVTAVVAASPEEEEETFEGEETENNPSEGLTEKLEDADLEELLELYKNLKE